MTVGHEMHQQPNTITIQQNNDYQLLPLLAEDQHQQPKEEKKTIANVIVICSSTS